MTNGMKSLLDRFLRYVSVETTSDENSQSTPSTSCQLNLLNMLCEELRDMGVEANVDRFGYVMACIPSNIAHPVPAIGFIAHVDTSPDMSGADVKPQLIENYGGGDIMLNAEKNVVLRVADFPEMKRYVGQTLITTDGTTLLGADDKAGVAEIMSMVHYVTKHPEFEHGDIKIAFTPDEEIGRGADNFDVGRFGADYAYTMDGGGVGELEYENFNAASAKITVEGCNIHPGYGKDRLLNSMLIAMELNQRLPAEQQPRCTEGYEGFFHLTEMNGTVEETTMSYIIRDHDSVKFEAKKKLMRSIVDELNVKYGNIVALELRDQYYNMRKEIEPHFFIVDKAVQAFEMAGITPDIKPIRGGTDGATLSYKGLPCPNIFAGGHNFHGRYEYVPLESMAKAVEVMLNIISLFAKNS